MERERQRLLQQEQDDQALQRGQRIRAFEHQHQTGRGALLRRVLPQPVRRRQPRQRRRAVVHQGGRADHRAPRRGQGHGRQELRGALAGRLRHDAGLEGTFAVGTVQLGRRPLDDPTTTVISTSRTADSPPTTSPSACSTAGRNPATSPTSRATASTPSSTTACWRTLRSCA